MTIRDQMKADLVSAIKEKDEERKNAIRVALGEFGRVDKKDLDNEETIRILKKLIKSEKEMLEAKGISDNSMFIRILEHYLPKLASRDEICEWIRQNIDFSQFKNKMQAMKPIMSYFGSSADGNIVKQILQEL
ncbi:MAG: GatB/YqeY domain-containing protein [Pseudomonadota bacterium]